MSLVEHLLDANELRRQLMCLSAGVSYAAAGILVPAAAIAVGRAYVNDRRYLAIAALPPFLDSSSFLRECYGPQLNKKREA